MYCRNRKAKVILRTQSERYLKRWRIDKQYLWIKITVGRYKWIYNVKYRWSPQQLFLHYLETSNLISCFLNIPILPKYKKTLLLFGYFNFIPLFPCVGILIEAWFKWLLFFFPTTLWTSRHGWLWILLSQGWCILMQVR